MAEFEEVINLKYKETGDPAKSVKSIKTEILNAKNEAIAAERAFGKYSLQAVDAAKEVAHLRHEQNEFNERVQRLNPQRFETFSKMARGIAGGFAAAQGAMALFGNESEETNKALLKVQSALALSQGIKELTEVREGFKGLVGSIKDAVIPAFKSAAGAARLIGSALGLGIIIALVATLVGYWDDIKTAITGVSKEQRNLVETTKATATAEEKKLAALSSSENILKLSGKSEREILQLKIKQTDAVILADIKAMEAADKLATSQYEADVRNKRILKGILEFISAPILFVLRGVDAIGKAVGKNFGLADGFTNGVANLLFDPEATAAKAKETHLAFVDSIDKLKNERAGFQLAILAMDKQSNKDLLAEAKKAAENLAAIDKVIHGNWRKYQKDKADEAKKFRDSVQTDMQKEIDAALKNLEPLKNRAGKEIEYEAAKTAAILAIQQKYRMKQSEINATYTDEAAQKSDADFDKELDKLVKQKQARLEIHKSLYDSTSAILGGIADLFGKQTALGKAFALAQIAADTAIALTSALRNAQSALSIDNQVSGGLSGLVKFGIIAAQIFATASRARAILAGGSTSGGGSGGGSSSGSFNIPLPSSYTPGSDRLRNLRTDNKVYVLEADISKTQERVSRNRQISVV